MAPTVLTLEELRRSETAALFEGDRHGDGIPVSIFITRYERGQGPRAHLHPYAEAFVVVRGTATFVVDGEETVVEAPAVVVVPPETPHGFENRAEGVLEVVSSHPSGSVRQTDL